MGMDGDKVNELEKTIRHWEHMISWVEDQDPSEEVREKEILDAIDECWYKEDCPLCTLYYDIPSCKGCPLAKSYGVCTFLNDKNLWNDVASSDTWGEWLYWARKFLDQIQNAQLGWWKKCLRWIKKLLL